jgi:hypothetical protein
MSNRSIKKRRHRPDFQLYMEQRDLVKELTKEGPLWKQAGYPTQASFKEALAKAQAAKVAEESQNPVTEESELEPMWKRCGYPNEEAYQEYLSTKPAGEPPHVHEHGDNCHHHH